MRLFFAILIIATYVGVNEAWQMLPPNYEYEFLYQAQVLSGIQTIDEQYSGVGFKCKVIIKTLENVLNVQFNDFQVGEINTKLSTVAIGEVPFKYNSIGQIQKYFSGVTKVITSDGIIDEIVVPSEEPVYVTNIKLGALTLLNIHLPPPGTVQSELNPRPSTIHSYGAVPTQHPSLKFRPPPSHRNEAKIELPVYNSTDDGIEGKCPGLYVVQYDPWEGNSQANAVNVTVTKTFEDCDDEDYVDWLRTTHVPNNCADCDEDDLDFLNTIKITEYDIVEDDTIGHYLIERIESRSETLFMLLTAEHNQLSTNHSQTLQLVRKSPLQGDVPPVQGKSLYKLQYQFPGLNTVEQPLTKEDLYKRPVPYILKLVPCATEKIHQLIRETALIIKDRKTGNGIALEKSSLLSRAFSTCSVDDINPIYNAYYPGRQGVEDSLERISWSIFRDTLMMSGTLPAMTIWIDKIVDQEISGEEANQIVMAIPLNIREPASVYIEEFVKIPMSAAAKSYTQLYTTSWLAYASLIDIGCGPDETVKPERPDVSDNCPDEHAQKLIQVIANELSSVQETWKKMVLLQACGLITNEHIIEVLRPYVVGEIYLPERARVLAIYAISDSVYEDSEKVLEIVSPIFADTNQSTVIRIAAVTVIKRAATSEHFLSKYGAWTWAEPDEQVANFMYTTLDELSNSTHPCNKEDAAHATYAESVAEESDLGIFGSQTKIFSNYIEDMGLGCMLKLAWVANNKTILPRSLYWEFNRTISGYSQQPLEGALHMQGAKTIIQRLFGPDSAVFINRTLADIIQGIVVDKPQGPRDIWEKLALLPREKSKLKISLWIKFISHMNRMVNFDGKSLVKSWESGILQKYIHQVFHNELKMSYQKIGYLGDVTYIFPSALGIPIHAQLAAPFLLDIKGKLRGQYDSPEVPNSVFEVKPLTLHIELAPSINVRVTGRLGVYNPITQNYLAAGISAGGHAMMPFVSNISVDLLSMKFLYSVKPAPFLQGAHDVKLLHYDVTPYTTARPYNTFELYSTFAKPIITKLPLDEYKYVLNPTVIGFPAKLRIKSDLFWQDQASAIDHVKTHGLLSSIFFWWATPHFHYQTYEVSVEPNPFCSTALSIYVEWNKIENRYRQLIKQGQINVEGIYGIVTGWSKPVWKCSKEEEVVPIPSFKFQDHESFATDYDSDAIKKRFTPRSQTYEKAYRQSRQSTPSSGLHEVPITGAEALFENQIIVRATVHGPVLIRVDLQAIYTKDYDKKSYNGSLFVSLDTKTSPSSLRSSLPSYQVCAKGYVKYPRLPCSRSKLLIPDTVKPIYAVGTVNWGESCEGLSKIIVAVNLSKSQDQKDDESKGEDWYRIQCKEDLAKGRAISEACDVAVEQATDLNRVAVTVKYHDLPVWMVNASHQFQACWKMLNYWQMSHNAIDVNNGEGKLRVVTEFDPTDPTLDMFVFKPKENLFFENIFYPGYSEYITPINVQTSLFRRFADDFTGGYYPPTCKVMADSIITFDNVTYNVGWQPCLHVLAKDCTDSDLFTILTNAPLLKSNALKVFVVYLLEQKITIRPILGQRGQFAVDFNGTLVEPLQENVAYMLEANDPRLNQKIVAVVTVTGDHLTLKAPRHGLMLRTDGKHAKIMLSNLWRGRTCGLCDDFTGDSTDEFTGPQQCTYEHAEDFIRQYAVADVCISPRKVGPKTCPSNVVPLKASSRGYYNFDKPDYDYYGPASTTPSSIFGNVKQVFNEFGELIKNPVDRMKTTTRNVWDLTKPKPTTEYWPEYDVNTPPPYWKRQ